MALRDRINIQTNSSTDDNPASDYTGTPTATNIAADIACVSGMEKFRGRQIEGGISWIVEVRNRIDLNTTDRVVVVGGPYAGRTLNIESMIAVRREAEPIMLQLHCTELV